MSVMDAVRRPTKGMRIEYYYNNTPGIIEVVDVNDNKIFFLDHYNNVERDYVVDFRWSTWDLHINSIVKIVGILSNEPDWEV